MTDPITVLIVDDHALVRRGIRSYFETQPDLAVVGEAETGAEAVALAVEHVPDVVLMDLIMPGMDGVEATRRVRAVSPRTQIVVLTSYHEDTHIFPAIKAGALSYLLKDLDPDELADAVRAAARGEAVLHPRVAARVMNEMRGGPGPSPGPLTELTDRELDVLRLIAEEGLSNAEIAESLVVTEKTVKGYVSNILDKLHLANRTQAAIYAWQQGIVHRKEPH